MLSSQVYANICQFKFSVLLKQANGVSVTSYKNKT